MTWASRRVFASQQRQGKRREGWRLERLMTQKKASEIRDWLGESRFYWCLHCSHVSAVETIRGRAGSLTCTQEHCNGNPLDWMPCAGPERYSPYPGPEVLSASL